MPPSRLEARQGDRISSEAGPRAPLHSPCDLILPVIHLPPPPLAALFLEGDGVEALPWAAGALTLSFAFSLLRASLLCSRTARVASRAKSEAARQRIEALLERVDSLATSASLLKLTCDVLFVSLILALLPTDDGLGWSDLLSVAAIAVPTLIFLTQSVPSALARRFGDGILLRVLPVFSVVQVPLQAIVWVLDGLNGAVVRVIGLREEATETREIVEGFREVIADSARRNDLDETERELIENVMEFSDVDVAEIMTPRTEIHGVDLEDGVEEVIRIAASEGHSSIPIFEENLDNVIGFVSARGIVQRLADGDPHEAELSDLVRPAYFVPETKLVTELLAEFRRGKRKMAIVLDEYGGTAGMVTLGDILGEIVGDIGDEYDREDPEPVRVVAPGVAVIEAGLRMAEVNEAMDLELPEEEDYETLGGFVLSELGHLPKPGEAFEWEGTLFEVIEASDRRVIRVRVRTKRAELRA